MAAPKPVKFHVAEEASPHNLIPIIEALSVAPTPGPADNAALSQLVEDMYGVSLRSEPITLGQDLGLIKRSEGFQLTSRGRVLAGLRQARRTDVLHYLLYTTWDHADPARSGDLWSYRMVCDALWVRQQVDPNSVTRELVEDVINGSHTVFADVPGYNPNKVSFSGKSVRGVRKWLEALSPPVITKDGIFARRTTCSAELLLLALGYTCRITAAELGVDLLLTTERRTQICRLALLDPAYLDRLLDWITPIYPQYYSAGTRTGAYGRFVRMLALPAVEDIA